MAKNVGPGLRRLIGMLCIWRGAPDWPEGPPAPDLSSIQPTQGLHNCFSPCTELPARQPAGLAWVYGGEPAGHIGGGPGLHLRSVWSPRWFGQAGWRAGRERARALGEGHSTVGGGPGGMKLLQMLLLPAARDEP